MSLGKSPLEFVKLSRYLCGGDVASRLLTSLSSWSERASSFSLRSATSGWSGQWRLAWVKRLLHPTNVKGVTISNVIRWFTTTCRIVPISCAQYRGIQHLCPSNYKSYLSSFIQIIQQVWLEITLFQYSEK